MKKTVSLLLACVFLIPAVILMPVRAEVAAPQISNITNDFNNTFSSVPSVITGENIVEGTKVYTLTSEEKVITGDPVEHYKASLNLKFPEFKPDTYMEALIYNMSGRVITAQLSGDFVWLVNPDGGVSVPYQINRLKIFWKDREEAEQGDIIRVFGQSFSNNSIVLLKKGDTFLNLSDSTFRDAVSARDTDNYLMNIKLPADIEPGKWELLLNNGMSNYCWVSAGELSVAEKKDDKEKEYDLKSFGAKGDGKSNDTKAFEKAVSKASKNGGTINVPPGTYLVDKTVELFENVSIKGSGASNTIIKGIGFDADTCDNISWFSSGKFSINVPYSVIYMNSKTSISDITVTGAVNRGKGGGGIVQLAMEEVNISIVGMCRDVLISGCVLDGQEQNTLTGERLYRNALYSSGSVERIRVFNNNLSNSLHFGGYNGMSYRCDIVGNIITGGMTNDLQAVSMVAVDCLVDDNTCTDSGRMVITPVRHCYIRANTLSGFAKQTSNNTTEGILAHGENELSRRTTGYVDSAAETTLSDSKIKFIPGIYKNAVLIIASGKGMGQYRFIADNTEDTLELKTPFSVIPDKTSQYTVGHFITENVYFNNVTSGGVGHLGISNDAIANIFSDYRDDRGGVVIDARDESNVTDEEIGGVPLDLSWYNVLTGSWIDGAAVQYLSYARKGSAYNATPFFANMITSCTLNMSGSDRNGFQKAGPIDALVLAGGDKKDRISDRYASSHIIIHNNALSNAKYGIKISKFSDSTLVLNNDFNSVEIPIDNAGGHTVAMGNTTAIMDDGLAKKTDLPEINEQKSADKFEIIVKPQYKMPTGDRKLAYDNHNLETFVSSVLHRNVDKKESTDKCADNLKELWNRIVSFESEYKVLPNADYYPENPYDSQRNIIRLLGQDAFDYGICPTITNDIDGKTNITYLWNDKLNGQPLSNISDRANTWVMTEMAAAHQWMTSSHFSGHEGGYHVLYADGTVKHVKIEEVKLRDVLAQTAFADPNNEPQKPTVALYSEAQRPDYILIAIISGAVLIVAVCIFLIIKRKKKKV